MTAHRLGRLVPAEPGPDLVLDRHLRLPLEDAWSAITEPNRTERWFGTWEGEGRTGQDIRVKMGFEDESPWIRMRIAECSGPHRLRLVAEDENGAWDLELLLTSVDAGSTMLRFLMHDIDPAAVGEIGPGWEYYLDQLVAAESGAPMPVWDDYFPALREHFVTQADALP